jgi:hypothetical protein
MVRRIVLRGGQCKLAIGEMEGTVRWDMELSVNSGNS